MPSPFAAGKERRALVAGRLLEIYADRDRYPVPWDQVVAEFGQPRDPATGSKWNSTQLRDWAIRAYLDDDDKRLGAARLMREYETLAYSDVGDYAELLQTMMGPGDFEKLPPHVRRAISEVSWDAQGRPRVKLHAKDPALKALAAIHGLVTERTAVDLSKASDDELQAELARLVAAMSPGAAPEDDPEPHG